MGVLASSSGISESTNPSVDHRTDLKGQQRSERKHGLNLINGDQLPMPGTSLCANSIRVTVGAVEFVESAAVTPVQWQAETPQRSWC